MEDDELEAAGPNRMVLFVAGGAVVALALALVILRAARTKPSPAVNLGIVDGDWKASIEHVAAAWDMRFAGMDARLEELAEALIMVNVGNAPSTPAAVSLPSEPIHQVDDDLMRPPPQPQVGALEPPPPSPAAVSM